MIISEYRRVREVRVLVRFRKCELVHWIIGATDRGEQAGETASKPAMSLEGLLGTGQSRGVAQMSAKG
jgi:hypothetical protein